MIALRTLAATLAVLVAWPTDARAAAPPRSGSAYGPVAPDTEPSPAEPDADPPAEGEGEGDEGGVDDADANDDELVEDDQPAQAEPATEPVRPRRYVWGGTEIEARKDGDAATQSGPGAAPVASPADDDVAPGGYMGPTDTKEVAPKDGERKLLVAYIVLPLGTLAMVSGAVATWLTHPDHCQERLGRLGNDVNPKQCRGLWILNIVRTTYGSMMIASGAVLLGLGLREKKRYREWTKKHGAFVQPWFQPGVGRGQGGLVFGGRF